MKSEKPILVESGERFEQATLAHRVWEPSGAGPHKTIVMLHGRAGNEDVTWVFGRTLPKEWLVFSPRAPFPDPIGGYSWNLRPSGDWPDSHDFTAAVEALTTFLNSLPALYDADLDNLYLLGFSQGTAVSFNYVMQSEHRPLAIASLVGLIATDAQTDPNIKKFQDLPVFMAVGRKDETVPLSVAHACANALVTGGARLDYREYDTSHKLNGKGLRDLADWWQQFE